ncbi:bifunctional oligoribonuclease/PAP phosphatase NrnA [Brevibacillus humidisoli]|uniref:DHH family phosphoesterase n=1 Tax=Brevibacillus humidisoli TaxID=2895522 RepID=UPI001E2DEBEA|nr:bifunctional oligoribonuclease/PAP phosphatase NrnA [Brevibacillus humidisoli]UFJ42171.1 bifunctional oligoribonuclease/PAP phosphatase NrnA [Brevibacillus humidisoli]
MSDYAAALQEAVRFMREHDRFLIISHVSPDGDTTSAALVTAQMLDQLGKSYVIVNEGATPAKFDYLPGFAQIVNLSEQPIEERFSHVIAVDAADSKRMGEVSHLFLEDVELLNIDHHPTNDYFGTVNVIRTDAAATVEIMFDLLEAGAFRTDPEIATCIYTGLVTDTGGFRYSNTSANVMEIAAKLLPYGVKPGEVAERCLEAITLGHVRLLQRALQTLQLTHRRLVASLRVTHRDLVETEASSDDLSGLVNYGRNIEGVEVGVLFTEMQPGFIKVNLRSRREVDVSQIAKHFGGGGHARAAGYSYVGSIADAEQELFSSLSEVLGVNRDE